MLVTAFRFVGKLIFLSLAVCVAEATPIPTGAEQNAKLVSDVAKIVRGQARKFKIPGGAFGLIVDGKVVYKIAEGPRRLTGKAKIDSETLFQIGSITKTFTSMVVANLVAKNKLQLEAPIKNYLTERCAPNRCEGITVAHLMSHTSGIPSEGINRAIESGMPYEAVIAKALAAERLCAPGTCFKYNNAAYELVKEIVEKVDGRPYREILKTELFTPLKLNSTGSTFAELKRGNNYFTPHLFQKNRYVATHHSTLYYAFPGSSVLNSNLDDMLQVLSAEMGYRPEVLSSESLKVIHQPVTDAADAQTWFDPEVAGHDMQSQYALGHRILKYPDLKVVFHGGWIKGCKSMMAMIPERKIGFVLLQNSESDIGFRVLEGVVQRVRNDGKPVGRALGR